MKQLERLVSAVLIVVFVAVAVPAILGIRRAQTPSRRPGSALGGGFASSPVGQPTSVPQPASPFPPPRITTERNVPIESVPAANPTANGGEVAIIARDTRSSMFTRWATVVVLFIIVTAAVGIAIAGYFAARMLLKPSPYTR